MVKKNPGKPNIAASNKTHVTYSDSGVRGIVERYRTRDGAKFSEKMSDKILTCSVVLDWRFYCFMTITTQFWSIHYRNQLWSVNIYNRYVNSQPPTLH